MNWIRKTVRKSLDISESEKHQRNFLWLIAAGCMVWLLYAFFIIEKEPNQMSMLIIISILAIFFSFTYEKIIFPVLICWIFLGLVIGEITSVIVLGIVFYLIITPLKWLRSPKTDSNSGWISSEESKFENQY